MNDSFPGNEAAEDYRVVHAANVALLVERVKRAQTGGWRVTGGLTHVLGAFYQAMVKGAPSC